MKKIFTLLSIFTAFNLSAQNKYIIYFTDKNDNPYTISNPSEFLTQRSIDRRTRQNISITTRDLPVTPKYVDSLLALSVDVWYTSRWFNAAIIQTDATTFNNLLSLDFVSDGTQVKRIKKKVFDEPVIINSVQRTASASGYDYGQSLNQVQQIGADEAHNAGYKGEGMIIGVMDSGFSGADGLDVFDSLFAENRVLGTYDFVNREVSVYEDHNHGMNVLSTMAALLPGQMIGTAPKASYYLFRTEDVFSEYWIEETNWLIAAERADSLGVDVLNTSLGYSEFSESQYNYTYSQMNGNTTIITRAADFAAKVGMLPVVSAGNEGSGSWYYITAPADADSVITVGAVNSQGNIASFSSRGPSADGRVKPNVCAMGSGSTVATTSNTIGYSSGTSFSGPILCGMVTCFWQANPNLTNMEVINFIQQSGTNFSTPDNDCGYGIPHFTRAQQALSSIAKTKGNNSFKSARFDENKLIIKFSNSDIGKIALVSLTDMLGKSIIEKNIEITSPEIIILNNTDELKTGIYLSRIILDNQPITIKLFRD